MNANTVNVIRIEHNFLEEHHYIDPLPPTVFMSNEGAAELADATIDWTLHHLDAKFEHTFPDDGVETSEFFEIFFEMFDSQLSPYMLDTKPETCPHTNKELFREADYAINKVFPATEEINAMPDTIDTPEHLMKLIITGIERVYNILMKRGTKAEPDEYTITHPMEA